MESKRKTLVHIDLSIWAKVRAFATMRKISVNSALETLLDKALVSSGYITEKSSQGKQMMKIAQPKLSCKKDMVTTTPTGEGLRAINQQVGRDQ